MKNLLFIMVITAGLFSCKKESVEDNSVNLSARVHQFFEHSMDNSNWVIELKASRGIPDHYSLRVKWEVYRVEQYVQWNVFKNQSEVLTRLIYIGKPSYVVNVSPSTSLTYFTTDVKIPPYDFSSIIIRSVKIDTVYPNNGYRFIY